MNCTDSGWQEPGGPSVVGLQFSSLFLLTHMPMGYQELTDYDGLRLGWKWILLQQSYGKSVMLHCVVQRPLATHG